MDNKTKVSYLETMIDLMNNPEKRLSQEELIEIGLTDDVIVSIVVEALGYYRQSLITDNECESEECDK